jgi:hypothetical protein
MRKKRFSSEVYKVKEYVVDRDCTKGKFFKVFVVRFDRSLPIIITE